MIAVAAISAMVMSLLVSVPAVADTQPPAGAVNAPATVSADPLPTVQINGVAWTQAVAGSTVYAAGEFTSARPAGAAPGTDEVPRSNILSYDIETGVMNSFAPSVNGRVLGAAVSPDGTRLYIAGGFTSVDGNPRYRLAAFDTATGELISNWSPGTNGVVNDVVATDTTVYVVGEFSNVNNTPRTRAAALDALTGAILPFNPVLDGGYGARAVVVSPGGSKVVIGGSFTSTNGSTNPGRGMAALDAQSGASLPWESNSVIRDAGTASAIYSLASDGDSVYGTGYDFGGSKIEDDWEGSFRADWSDGSLEWMEDCHGDSYSVFPFKGAVYKASHTHYCGNIGEFPQLDPWKLNYSLAFSKEPSDRTITPDIWGYRSFTGNTAGKLLHWYPEWVSGKATGINQAGWDVTASGDYLLYAGEFTRVSGVAQQGLVRFTTGDKAPNDLGPVILGGAWPITTSSFRAGSVRVGWQANHDPDNAELTYEVFRQGTSEPIYTTTAESTFWVRPLLSYNDESVTAGQTYEYRVRVTDPHGNSTQSDWTSVTVSSADTGNSYNQAILDAQPTSYWPLSEASGATAYNWAGDDDLTFTAGVTRGTTGQVVGEASTASSFSGSSSFGVNSVASQGPDVFSVEAWFKTTSTSGGKIVGFGNKNSGTSSSYDRHIYINGQGRVTFGVYPGSTQTISTGTGYNDGAWHQAIGTLGADGMTFYVDGVKVGALPSITNGESYRGYWRVGGDTVGSWPQGGASFLAGQIADVAIYDRVLSRDEVDAHWVASGRTSSIPPAPSDAYGANVYGASPVAYWRLDETSGSVAADSSREQMPAVIDSRGGSVVLGEPGALSDGVNNAVRFTSSKNFFGSWTTRQVIVSSRPVPSPSVYAIEGWFKTTTDAGGKLIGFGNSNSNTANASSTYDRHIYMTPSGQLKFGTYDGAEEIITAPGTYRDGTWHHVVAQQSAEGMQFFVDGLLVGTNPATSSGSYTGYWRLGGDSTWEGAPYWVGSLDEVAIYGAPLSAAQVEQHYEAGRTGAVNALPEAEFQTVITDLDVAFDASGSKDAEGPIASYSWDFGDGQTGTGSTTTHSYAEAGDYTVALTVTDSGGLSTTVDHDVTVVAPNVAPTASFTTAADHLDLSVDAASSTDPDGELTTYAWTFGDGAQASGVTAAHTYASAGTYDVTLVVTDDRGGSATDSKQVTVTAPPVPNVPPVAGFTATVDADDLVAAFDATSSSDEDGTVEEYDWDFGDGENGSGVTVSHQYAAAGTYTVKLTVVDDDGDSHSTTRDIEVVPADVIAADAFERTASGAWNSADVGGDWTVTGGAAAFSVADGTGMISLAPSYTREAKLSSVSSTAATVDLVLSSSAVSSVGATSVTIAGRLIGSAQYSARVRFEPGGTVRLYLLRSGTPLGGGSVVLPETYEPGDRLHVRMAAIGTAPTELGMKVWEVGATEPSAWAIQATDDTPELQTEGSFSIRSSVSASATVPTTVIRIDDLRIVSGTVAAPPAPNQSPTAAFTSTADGLKISVDGSGSTDSDGTIASAAWDFGDGESATGLTAEHVYAAAGTYAVKLSVTDDDGAVATHTAQVNVIAPPPPGVLVDDQFERTVNGGWGIADTGAPWTVTGGSAAFTVADGAGTVTLAPSQTREARLNELSSTSAIVDTSFSSDVASNGGTVSVSVIGRMIGSATYSGRVRLEPTGIIRVYALRDETPLGSGSVVLPVAYTAGLTVHVRVAVTGTSPTNVAVKVWLGDSPEPEGWTIQATDSEPAHQAAGSVSLKIAASSVSTNPTTRISFDHYSVTE